MQKRRSAQANDHRTNFNFDSYLIALFEIIADQLCHSLQRGLLQMSALLRHRVVLVVASPSDAP
jgi:hypothetical protein